MTIIVPDPDTGRCRNYRHGRDAYGQFVMRRCLDYEGHDGRCEFEPDPECSDAVPRSYTLGGSLKPKPWVSPLKKGRKL